MSLAGRRSSQGDYYELLVAMDWALRVLCDSDYEWLEIDSVSYRVDDVVIGKADGSEICCQCKKNEPNFTSWSIANLADELNKAVEQLILNPKTTVRFYSRNNFGVLAKLREFSTNYNNEAEYNKDLTQKHIDTNQMLFELILKVKNSANDQNLELSTFDFLSRTSFVVSSTYEDMEGQLKERLKHLVSNSNTAYDTLCMYLNKPKSDVESKNLSTYKKYRITKKDLKRVLYKSGAILVPPISISKACDSFSTTSSIGRNWRRKVGDEIIKRPVLDEILIAIDDKKNSILLSGIPGSGKTCVMLGLQEALEKRNRDGGDIVPLFIQSREFVDLTKAHDRQALGLAEQWVEQAARLADEKHVVVIIDSLDVLSIARENKVFTYFLAKIDQLLQIPNVTLVTACRDFDRKYDRRIAVRDWDLILQCPPLDWEKEIAPLLNKLKVDLNTIDSGTRELIKNPRELDLFIELVQGQNCFNGRTSQTLAQYYLKTTIQDDHKLGNKAMKALEKVAEKMLLARKLSITRQQFKVSDRMLQSLCSLNILQTTNDNNLIFGHQTLLDVLVISRALRRELTLNEFIKILPPVPFVRPSIRSFVEQLAAGDRSSFRRQVRAVLEGNEAFHIRRLVAESFAQTRPEDDDWPLIRALREKHSEVFQIIYVQGSSVYWHHFWLSHLVPMFKETGDKSSLASHASRLGQWVKEDPVGIIEFCSDVLLKKYSNESRVPEQIGILLSQIDTDKLYPVAPLLERLLDIPRPEHSSLKNSLGENIACWVDKGVVDDVILWRYIAGGISDSDILDANFSQKLHCRPYQFRGNGDAFLKLRMRNSIVLLDLALEAIEGWSKIKSAQGNSKTTYRRWYLRYTSYNKTHSPTFSSQDSSSISVLFNAIEEAIIDHAKDHSEWWEKNRERLIFNNEGALRYIAVIALTNVSQKNIDFIGDILSDKALLESNLSYELSMLTEASFIYLDQNKQDLIMSTILNLYEWKATDKGNTEGIVSVFLNKRIEYISVIPCHPGRQDSCII